MQKIGEGLVADIGSHFIITQKGKREYQSLVPVRVLPPSKVHFTMILSLPKTPLLSRDQLFNSMSLLGTFYIETTRAVGSKPCPEIKLQSVFFNCDIYFMKNGGRKKVILVSQCDQVVLAIVFISAKFLL